MSSARKILGDVSTPDEESAFWDVLVTGDETKVKKRYLVRANSRREALDRFFNEFPNMFFTSVGVFPARYEGYIT